MFVAAQCPTFYTKYNQRGKAFQLCSSANVPQRYDNKVSSFLVPAGYSVMLYEGSDYAGQALGPYTQGSYDMPSHFNDQLSSVQVEKVEQTCDTDCATFYTGYNQTGQAFQICLADAIPAQYKNQILSFTVPSGRFIAFYGNPDSDRPNLGYYTEGSYNTPADIQDKISSVLTKIYFLKAF